MDSVENRYSSRLQYDHGNCRTWLHQRLGRSPLHSYELRVALPVGRRMNFGLITPGLGWLSLSWINYWGSSSLLVDEFPLESERCSADRLTTKTTSDTTSKSSPDRMLSHELRSCLGE